MGFWDFMTGGVNHAGEIPNANPPSTPSTVGAGEADGDPNGVEGGEGKFADLQN